MGAVNQLCCERIIFFGKKSKKAERHWIEADPRYFCVIGLVKGFLSMEIICHEAVHAGLAYAKRHKRTPWDEHIANFEEEALCYPSGKIAAEINRAIHDAGLYE